MSQAKEHVQITDLLRSLVRRRRHVNRMAAMMYAGRVGLALLMLGFMIDAIAPLPAITRLGIFLIAVGFPAWQAIMLLRDRLNMDDAVQSEAHSLDQQQEESRNSAINAVQFAGSNMDSSLTGKLMQRSIENATEQYGQTQPNRAIDPAPYNRQGFVLIAVVGMLLIVSIVNPILMWSSIVRFAAPWSDMPAYGLTKFDVTVTPNPFFPGDRVFLYVQTTGAEPTSMYLVKQGETGGGLAMRRSRGGDWSRELHDVKEPMTFRFETATGSSEWIHLGVTDQPRRVFNSDEKPTASESSDAQKSTASPSPDMQINQLYDALGDLRDQSRELQGESLSEEEMAKLEAGRQDIVASAEAMIAGTLRLPDHERGSMQNLIESLKQLQIREQQRPTGEQDSENWAQALASAAEQDMTSLSDSGQKDSAGNGGGSGQATLSGEADRHVPTIPMIGGVSRTESRADAERQTVGEPFGSGEAPEAYRELTAEYFRQIAEDQKP